ncbi:MAG: FG-GAP repeat protein [Planctomycetes bacterium]|nr:FG-GAP repeat protein [Planctomycetota bacterium]
MRIGKLAPLFVLIAIASAAAATPPIGEGSTAPEAASPAGLSSSDWTSIRAAYDAGRHKIVAVGNGWRGRNPGQGWITTFDERGFTTNPDGGGWSWGLELVGYGWGEPVALAGPARSTSADGGRLSRDWNGRITEWYVNERRGLEHGFTVAERPRTAVQPLTLEVAVRSALVPAISSDGRNVSFTNPQGGSALNYSGLTVLDAGGHPVNARWKNAQNDRLRLVVDDTSAKYPLTIDPVAQQAYLKASNPGVTDYFGSSVAVSGDTVVVGAHGEDSSATGVNGNQADNSAMNSGAAYVFVRSGSIWSQPAYLKSSNTGALDCFGASVSISHDTIVVGAFGEASSATGVNGNEADNSALNSGAAYIFVRNAATWIQQAYLKASNSEVDDRFGSSVSISGDTVVVGALFEDSNAKGVNGTQSYDVASSAGAAYVFIRSGSTWSQEAYLKASNTDPEDHFGSAVSIANNTIVIGAWGEDSSAMGVNGNQYDNSAPSAGASYVFIRNSSTWSQEAYLKASNADAGDGFGAAVAIDGDTIVVGSSQESSNATSVNGNQFDNSSQRAGAAYVFSRTGSTWSQQVYLKASNSELGDEFGSAVAISGETLVIGAYQEDSNATIVNGDQYNNSATSSGAVYIFSWNGRAWSQQAYLKASNANAVDFFGSAVAISGGLLVVGATSEDSSASGIDGNQLDDSASQSGAAYVFHLTINPIDSGLASYGIGTSGCAGVHALSAQSPPQVGNMDFGLRCTNPAPLTTGLWLITDAQDLAGSDPFGIGAVLHVGLFTAT